MQGSWHRTHQSTSRTENAKKAPVPQRLSKPVSATEGASEYAPCPACGRSCRKADGAAAYCNDNCRRYVSPPARKPDGEWFVVAGPVDYCAGCALAIGPAKPPRRRDGALYCRECADARGVKQRQKPREARRAVRVQPGGFERRNAQKTSVNKGSKPDARPTDRAA
jgi:hypothetical protein